MFLFLIVNLLKHNFFVSSLGTTIVILVFSRLSYGIKSIRLEKLFLTSNVLKVLKFIDFAWNSLMSTCKTIIS